MNTEQHSEHDDPVNKNQQQLKWRRETDERWLQVITTGRVQKYSVVVLLQ